MFKNRKIDYVSDQSSQNQVEVETSGLWCYHQQQAAHRQSKFNMDSPMLVQVTSDKGHS